MGEAVKEVAAPRVTSFASPRPFGGHLATFMHAQSRCALQLSLNLVLTLSCLITGRVGAATASAMPGPVKVSSH